MTVPPRKAHGGPRRGEVVGERYEIRDRLREDAFSSSLLAFDQETEDAALVRVVRRDLLDDAARRQVAQRLQGAVGIGGRFSPGLTDADRDGELVYTVEPVPEGAPLRDVLDRRRHDGSTLEAHELLPVVARLGAALAAVPPPWRHGDVRATQVWIDPERLQLTGPFLLSALPIEVVRRVLESSDDLRRRHAPEVLRGTADDAADRYGVAIIAAEALLGMPPPEPGEAVGQGLGPVGEALRELLHRDPRRRATSLDPLCEALSLHAGLPAPDIAAGAFRRARRLSVARPPSEPGLPKQPSEDGLGFDEVDSAELEGESTATDIGAVAPASQQTATDVEVAHEPRPAPATKTQLEVAAGEPTVEERLPSMTGETRRVVLSTDTLEEELPSVEHAEETRAIVARTIAGAATEGTQEIDASDFLEADDEPAGGRLGRVIAGAEAEGTQEITADQLIEHGLRDDDLGPDDGLAPRPKISTQELTRPRARVTPDSGPLDPRLVRAALDVQLEDSGEAVVDGPEPDSLDPRLVRAALDVQLEDSGQQKLPPAPVKPGPPRERTMKIALDDIEMVPVAAPAPVKLLAPVKRTAPRAQRAAPAAAPARTRSMTPAGVKPVPRARKASDPRLEPPPGEVLFDDSPASRQRSDPPPPTIAPARAAPHAERVPAPPSNPGRMIVAFALILGIAILAGSILFATWRRGEADDREERRLQERYRQLQLEADS